VTVGTPPPACSATPLAQAFCAALPEGAAAQPELSGLEAVLTQLLARARERWPTVSGPAVGFAASLAGKVRPGSDPVEGLRGLPIPDLYLAWACGQGDPEAIRQFHEHMVGDAGILFGKGQHPTPTEVEELRQVLNERLFVGSHSEKPRILGYTGRGPLQSWARVAAKRILLNWRTRDREAPTPGAWFEGLTAEALGPELEHLKSTISQELNRVFPVAAAKLEARDRSLLQFRFVDGLSIDRIGDIYGIHRATAARQVEQAQTRLGLILREELKGTLDLSDSEFERLFPLVRSQFDVSLRQVLKEKR
jgi:RNA polymerase sigma-70 factor